MRGMGASGITGGVTDDARPLRISDLWSGPTRRALLGLEPGSRIWLEVDGRPVLFERMRDHPDGRSAPFVVPVGDSVEVWRRLCAEQDPLVMGYDFVERPADAGSSADRWCGDEEQR